MSDSPINDFLARLSDQVAGLRGDALAAHDDLEFYSRYVIGHDNPEFVSNSRFLRQVYDELQHNEEPDKLILGPRGSAKSTAVSVVYTTWRIGRNPLIRILLAVSSIEAQGLAFGRQIGHILEHNSRFISIFGNLVPSPSESTRWTDTEKIVVRAEPPGGLKDPTLGIVGVGSAVPSKRCDIAIVDDVVTAANAYSPIQRAKVSAFVFQTLFPTIVPSGVRIIVGSRWDPRDLYSEYAEKLGYTMPIPPPLMLPADA
jgi:hypothetical protein